MSNPFLNVAWLMTDAGDRIADTIRKTGEEVTDSPEGWRQLAPEDLGEAIAREESMRRHPAYLGREDEAPVGEWPPPLEFKRR